MGDPSPLHLVFSSSAFLPDNRLLVLVKAASRIMIYKILREKTIIITNVLIRKKIELKI